MKAALFAAGLLAASCAADPAAPGAAGKSCTEIGCVDRAAIVLRRADGELPQQPLTVRVDGQTVTCEPPARASTSVACGAGVELTVQTLATCKETRTGEAVSQSCTPTGRFELVVSVRGTPQAVQIAGFTPDGLPFDQTFRPTYTAVQPNGADCPPICQQASQTFDLPR